MIDNWWFKVNLKSMENTNFTSRRTEITFALPFSRLEFQLIQQIRWMSTKKMRSWRKNYRNLLQRFDCVGRFVTMSHDFCLQVEFYKIVGMVTTNHHIKQNKIPQFSNNNSDKKVRSITFDRKYGNCCHFHWRLLLLCCVGISIVHVIFGVFSVCQISD